MTNIPIAFPVSCNLLVLDVPISYDFMMTVLPCMPQIQCLNNLHADVNLNDSESIFILQSLLPHCQYTHLSNGGWSANIEWLSIEIWSREEQARCNDGQRIN